MKNFVVSHPLWIVAACAAMVVGAAVALPKLANDPNPEILPAHHDSRVAHERLKERYTGNRDIVVVMLETEDGVFNPATLERIPLLSAAFRALTVVQPTDVRFLADLHDAIPAAERAPYAALLDRPEARATGELALEARRRLEQSDAWTAGLEAGLNRYLDHLYPIVRIHSLADTDNIVAQDGGLVVKRIYDAVPETDAAMAALEREVTGNELFEDLLVSGDATRTGMYLELSLTVEDAGASQDLLDHLNAAFVAHPGAERVYVAGMPVTTSTITETIDADMAMLFPIVLIVVLVVLRFSFGDVKGVVLPVLVVVASLVSTLGIMAAAGVALNVITASLPVFLISIGIADGVHFYAEYRTQYLVYRDKRQAVSRTLELLSRPIALTSITTALAFWSLTFTEITQIAMFGAFVGIGTLLAMAFSLLLLPALAMLLPPPATARLEDEERRRMTRIVDACVRWVGAAGRRRPTTVVVCALVVFAVAVMGARDVSFDNNRVRFFSEGSDLVTSVERIRSALAGSEVLNIDLKATGRGDEPFKSPELLGFVDDLEVFALEQQHVGASISLAKLVRRMNLVMHDGDPAYNVVPSAAGGDAGAVEQIRRLVSQYVFLYESGGGDLLSDVVSADFAQSNVKLYLRTNSSAEIEPLMRKLERYAEANAPEGVDVSFAGNGSLLVAAGDEIILGQMKSLVLCVLIVAALLVVQFRSLTQGLLGFAPLALTVTVNFGLLGFLGVNIDIGTAIVSSVAIGIGVDYSIHYLCRFNHLCRRGVAPEEAIDGAVASAGRAITYNAVVVGTAFLVLLVSGFVPINTIGWLVSLSLFVSCIATLVVIPSLLRLGTAPRRGQLFVRAQAH